MTKEFKVKQSEIKNIASGFGDCVASDMITVRGRRIGYMYRNEPKDSNDSGWCFVSGYETQKFMDNPNNHERCDINFIANYDENIVPLLNAPINSVYKKNNNGGFDEIKELNVFNTFSKSTIYLFYFLLFVFTQGFMQLVMVLTNERLDHIDYVAGGIFLSIIISLINPIIWAAIALCIYLTFLYSKNNNVKYLITSSIVVIVSALYSLLVLKDLAYIN